MKKDCYTIVSITKYVSSNTIVEIDVLNSFETEEQAIASLKYEEQVETFENGHMVKWNSQTEIQISGLRNFDEIVILRIDNGDYHEKNERPILYKR